MYLLDYSYLSIMHKLLMYGIDALGWLDMTRNESRMANYTDLTNFPIFTSYNPLPNTLLSRYVRWVIIPWHANCYEIGIMSDIHALTNGVVKSVGEYGLIGGVMGESIAKSEQGWPPAKSTVKKILPSEVQMILNIDGENNYLEQSK